MELKKKHYVTPNVSILSVPHRLSYYIISLEIAQVELRLRMEICAFGQRAVRIRIQCILVFIILNSR